MSIKRRESPPFEMPKAPKLDRERAGMGPDPDAPKHRSSGSFIPESVGPAPRRAGGSFVPDFLQPGRK